MSCPPRPLHQGVRKSSLVGALLALMLATLSLSPLSRPLVADPPQAEPGADGKQLYQRLCADCHGDQGEGVADQADEPLYGDRSVNELAEIITKTMPKESPEQCQGEDARRVAEYMHDTFYTAEARARRRAPRIELSRLTVPQYLTSVADLVGEFMSADGGGRRGRRGGGGGAGGGDNSSSPENSDSSGLRGEYYGARNFQRDKRVLERVDPLVDFSYGEQSPLPDQINAEEYAVRWSGSLRVDETGDYDLALLTENGARLWINDPDRPAIDAWVASGVEPREHATTVRLLGGRSYPLRVEFFKFKQQTASLVLRWRPPGLDWQTIPTSRLEPRDTAPTLVVATAFPPDDGSTGYPRGITISAEWDEATTAAALEVAAYVGQRLDRFARVARDAPDRASALRRFCEGFVERAFRRPLSDELRQRYVDGPFAATDPDAAVRRCLLMTLKSPRFLYPELPGTPADDYTVASRLALSLWDSLPDRELLEAAAKGELRTKEQVRAQAERMLGDPRARVKLAGFFHQWLPLGEGGDVAKDVESFPGYDQRLLADLRVSLQLFLDDVLWSDASDYRQLLLGDQWFVNGRLAKFYGLAEAPADDEFVRVAANPEERAGVITHPFLLTVLAYHKSSSPIHRGVFLTRRVLGRALKPPPMAIQFMDARFDPSLTMREKVSELTQSDACQTCHSVINPLGFALERYDAVGRYRTTERERTIDASSDYPTLSGEAVHLDGARSLAEYAAASPEAQRGFVEQLFQHLTKQAAIAYGGGTAERLHQEFANDQFHIRHLAVAIAIVDALRE